MVMMTNRICPKCRTGKMYTIGGGCNYRCELCGHTYYEAPPRTRFSSDIHDAISENTRRGNQAKAEFDAALRDVKAARKTLDRQRKAEKQRHKAQKNQKGKGISLGTIIGVIFVLWLLSQLLS